MGFFDKIKNILFEDDDNDTNYTVDLSKQVEDTNIENTQKQLKCQKIGNK